MSVAPPPRVVVTKQRGPGCWIGGCVGLLVLVLLILGLIAGLGYFGFGKIASLTSTAPAAIPTFDGGEAVFRGANQKITAFNQALQQNRPATLQLSANEINTLITRNPAIAGNGIRAFVTLHDTRIQLRASFPTNLLPLGLIKDRYIDLDADFTPALDSANKNLNLVLKSLRIGGNDIPATDFPTFQNEINPPLNAQLKRSPESRYLLDHAQSLEIENNQLTLQTQ